MIRWQAADAAHHADINSLSRFELLLLLLTRDWQWRRLPRKQARRLALPPYRGQEQQDVNGERQSPQICYSAGVSVSTSYLACLAFFAQLGLDAVPHGETEDIYKALLNGQKWAELQVTEASRRGGKSQCRPEMSYDGEEAVGMAAERLGGIQPDAMAMDEDNELCGVAGFLDRLDDCLGSCDEQADSTEQSSESGNSNADRPSVGLVDPPLLGSVTPAEGQEDAPRASGPAEAAVDFEVPRVGRWGIFQIGRKRASVALPFGGIECLCPLHARNQRTGCKKFFRNLGPEPADLAMAIRKAKHWAIQGVNVRRQWEHIFTIEGEPAPLDQELNACIVTALPPNWSAVDDESFYAGSQQPRPGRPRPKTHAVAPVPCRGLRGKSNQGLCIQSRSRNAL